MQRWRIPHKHSSWRLWCPPGSQHISTVCWQPSCSSPPTCKACSEGHLHAAHSGETGAACRSELARLVSVCCHGLSLGASLLVNTSGDQGVWLVSDVDTSPNNRTPDLQLSHSAGASHTSSTHQPDLWLLPRHHLLDRGEGQPGCRHLCVLHTRPTPLQCPIGQQTQVWLAGTSRCCGCHLMFSTAAGSVGRTHRLTG
jgi:hypothetical protein